MKKANLYFGILLFVSFLITGYYLKYFFKPQNINNLVLRMEIRANHVYIIFISLLNIISFKCELSNGKKWTTYLDFSFRILLILSGVIATYAFMFNHNGNLIGRNWTLLSVVLSLSSIILFLTNELIFNISKNKTTNR
jgi:uncharacterized membrane protein